MPDLVCPHCGQTAHLAEHQIEAPCPACAKSVAMPMTQITAGPITSPAIQARDQSDWTPKSTGPVELPATYASWEEFRTLSPTVQRVWAELAMTPLPEMRRLEREPLPESSAALTDGFGPQITTFTTPGDGRIHRALVHLISMTVLASAVGIIVVSLNSGPKPPPREWDHVIAGIVYGIGGIGFACWLSLFHRPTVPATYWVMEDGIVWQRASQVDAARWQDIKHLRIERPGSTVRLVLRLGPNHDAVLNSAAKPAHLPLIEYIVAKAKAAQFLPNLRRIYLGETVDFGVIQLRRDSILFSRRAYSWSHVARVMTDRTHIHFDFRRSSLWSISAQQVALPELLVALCTILIDEHRRLPQDDSAGPTR